MKSLRLPTGLVASLVLGLVFVTGCSEDNTGPGTTPGESDPDISAQFGGYESTDELPAFDDEDLLQDLAGEVSVSDPIGDETETRDLEDDPDGTSYAVTLRWGILERRPNGDLGGPEMETIDWSGSLTTSAGRIVLRHLYSFEPGDEAVFPRDDAAVLEWISQTQGGVDGLTIVVHVPAELPGDLSDETLVLDTAGFDLTLTLDQLTEWDETYDVDDAGNQIRVNAMESGAAVSAQGWVMGRWGWDRAEDLGRFEGQWVHPRTGIAGFVRGHYGPHPESGLVGFFGKYIDRAGNFEGLLRGTVRILEGDLEEGIGTFQGGWYSRTGESEGALRGRWIAGGERGGYFSGIWCATCPVHDGLGGGDGDDDDDGDEDDHDTPGDGVGGRGDIAGGPGSH